MLTEESSEEKYQRERLKHQKSELKLKYGLTPEDYDRMFKEQNGVCKICKFAQRWKKRLAVDHDHATGKVRGLLCFLCNRGIGMMRDSIPRLRAAIKYLEESKVGV